MSLLEERKKVDERLFEEEYAKLKGDAKRKYSLIPKFYSKVRCPWIQCNTTINTHELIVHIVVYSSLLTHSHLVMTKFCSRSSGKMPGTCTYNYMCVEVVYSHNDL